MAIRLTETRLRQIIKEEAGKLKRTRKTRSLRESREAFDAAFDRADYAGLVDELYNMDPAAEGMMQGFCAEGDPESASAYLQKYFPMMGVESEDEHRVLDEIGKRCGVVEFSMMGYDF